jgi:hypothetical protein
MGRPYTAYDVTGFLETTIGSFLSEIEDLVIEMMMSNDYEERERLKNEIQAIICQCSDILR